MLLQRDGILPVCNSDNASSAHTGSSCSAFCCVSAHMDLPLSICKSVQLCVNCFLLSVLLPMTHCLCTCVWVSVCLCARCQPCVLSVWSIWREEGVEGCVYVSRGGGRDDVVCANVCLSFRALTSRRGVRWIFTGQKYKSGQLSGRNRSSLGWRLISNSWLESNEEPTHLHNAGFQLTTEPNHRFGGKPLESPFLAHSPG